MSKHVTPYIKSESLTTDFEHHLNEEFNERILFSGPFGAGKSTFLKKFFDDKKYLVLKLYPVNYSVAPNEDVFELIKFEILYELLRKYPEDIELQQDQFSLLLISQMFVLHRMKIDLPLKLLAKASNIITGSNVPNDTIVDKITQMVNSFNEYKKEINENEYSLLNKYIKDVQSQKGHVYELDAITELIVSLLERLKKNKIENTPNIKTILLIDDLDRLDPEHIFRLFNVFSAHYDDDTETNKFNFDKIIFVCDVKNIREMFNHKYGFNVEFTGYIDKFYSSEVFKFDLNRYLKESLPQIINDSIYQPHRYFQPEDINNSYVERYRLNQGSPFYRLIIYILKDLIDLNLVRIRSLERFKHFTLPNNILETKYDKIHAIQFPLLVLLSNLEKLFPNQIDLVNAFDGLSKNYKASYELTNDLNRKQDDYLANTLIQHCLPFILEENLFWGVSKDDDKSHIAYPFNNELGGKIYVIYSINHDWGSQITLPKYIRSTLETEIVDQTEKNQAILRPNPYWFLVMWSKIVGDNF